MCKDTNKKQLERIRSIQSLLEIPDEEFLKLINPCYIYDENDEWHEFSEYENGTYKIPDNIFNRILLLAYRNDMKINFDWLVSGKTLMAAQ